MQITGGGLLILGVIAAIIGGIYLFKYWRSGRSLSLTGIKSSFKRQAKDPNLVECFNIYTDKIVCESMLANSVSTDGRLWEIGTKKYVAQIKESSYQPLKLQEEVLYPPERLARMMGCEPLRRLKSMKFQWYEQLAPFAPVVALLIGTFLLMLVK